MTERLPELHVHLEGTISHATASELAAAHGLAPPPPYEYSDLSGFMAIYRDVCRCMTTADDFERVIVEHARAMATQHIAYAELSINPSLHPGEGWVDGMVRARRRVVDEFGVEIAWLVELVRGESMEDNERALEIALATEGVVGLGLVGDESIPSSPLLPLVQRARARGVDDASLLNVLATRDICLCVCPSSNARIGRRPDFRMLAASGVALTVNSDDPAMVGTTLTHELDLAEADHGLRRDDMISAAWRYSFK
ncbi:MAG: hypothetical protein E6I30_00045 [Chloroflexi bacterium]|nr:MAG: hypothetical protein E6I30_00045 [Chloroflexota bacterium]